jgi:chloramphenicol 3-O phosphotransferase
VVTEAGTILVLNGTPRSGKTTVARAIQRSFDGVWLNVGVDLFSRDMIPDHLRPGIGLRPGGERPDLEEHLPLLFDALSASVTALSQLGLNVVVDVGLHDDHTRPLGILQRVARELAGFHAYLIGVRCPVDVIMARRDAGEPGRQDIYVKSGPTGKIPEIVGRWERTVHDPGLYDLEVDTSAQSPEECAAAIQERLDRGSPRAFSELANRSG